MHLPREVAGTPSRLGRAGFLLYNNQAGVLNPTVAGAPPLTIPVAAVPFQSLGNQIVNSLTRVDVPWTAESAAPRTDGNLMSDFSSYGNRPELNLKRI